MANPIKRDDIISPDALDGIVKLNEALKNTIKTIDSIVLTAEELNKKLTTASGLKDVTTNLNKQQTEAIKLEKEQQNLLIKNEQLTQAKINTEAKQQKLNTQIIREQERKNKESEKAAKAAEKEQSAYGKLTKQLNDQRKSAKDLAATYGVNSEQAKAAAKAVKELDKQVKEIDKSVGQHQRNVGNYTSALSSMSSPIGAVISGFKMLKTAMSGAFLPITAIVGAITGLVAALKRSEEGANLLAKGMAYVKAALGTVLDVFTRLAEKIAGDPMQALKDFGQAILDQIVNRFTAIPKLIDGVFNTVVGSFQWLGAKIKVLMADVPLLGNAIDAEKAAQDVESALEKIQDGAVKTGKALTQVVTGFDETQQQNVINGFKNLGKAIADNAKNAYDLEKASQDLAKAQREWTVEREKLTAKITENRAAINDENNTTEEAIRLNNEAIELNNKIYEGENKLRLERLRIAKERAEINASDTEALNEIATLEAEQIRTKTEHDSLLKTLYRNANKLRKEQERAAQESAETTEEINAKELAAIKKLNEYKLQARINEAQSAQEVKDIRTKALKDEYEQVKLNTELTNTELEVLHYEYIENLKKIDDDYIKYLDNANKEKLRINRQYYRASADLANSLFALGGSLRDRELSELEYEYERKIAVAEKNGQDTEHLEKELAIKKAKIDLEKAKANRNQALFNIAISTSENFVKTLLTPLKWLVLAVGAAQTAAVLAQPLPKLPEFFRGTEDAPAGLAWLAERGSELVKREDGSTWLAEQKGLYNLQGGEKIFTHEKTQNIINKAILTDAATNNNTTNEQLIGSIDMLNRSIKNQKHVHINLDKNGFGVHMRQQHNWITYINNKYRS